GCSQGSCVAALLRMTAPPPSRSSAGSFGAHAPQDDGSRSGTPRGLSHLFLNNASNAERASSGVATARLPVRSKVFAGAKKVHSFFAFFETMRAGMGFEHSKRAEVSKFEHWLHECSDAPHLRQRASTPIESRSRTRSPQC